MATSHQNQHRAKQRLVHRVALVDTSDTEQLAQGDSAWAGLYFPAPDCLAGFVDVHLQQHLRQGAASGCEGSVQGTLSPAAHKATRQAKT